MAEKSPVRMAIPGKREVHRAVGAVAQPGVVDEEERLVPLDRPTDIDAELVPHEGRTRLAVGVVLEGIGVQQRVLIELVERAVVRRWWRTWSPW